MAAVPASLRLAENVARFGARDVPPEVGARARLALLDTVGAMLVGAQPRHVAGRLVARFVRAEAARPEATLVGQGARAGRAGAALANATLAYCADLEPHHAASILHAPAVVFPAALAVGEAIGAPGRRVLAAMVVGLETAGRVSDAMDPAALYARGFHPTAVCGAFGAAAAAGRLLGLSARRQAIALGLACQQASGLLAWASDPTEHSRPLNPGLAARNGVTAAALAAAGLGGPAAPFDGRYDAFTAFSGAPRPELLDAAWGERFYTAELSHKRYASCAFTHPGLDALLGLARDHRLRSADVLAITLRFPKSGAHMIDGHPLRSHCAQYVLPVGLVYGGVRVDDILADRNRHPEVARLARSFELVADPSLDAEWPGRYVSEVEIRTRDGGALVRRVAAARGTPENPMTPDEIRRKYDALLRGVVPDRRAAAIRAAALALDRLPDVRGLGRLLRPAVGRARRARRGAARR
jgi:2-methylcitrate dehydratase PrpD